MVTASEAKRERAAALLTHYMTMVMERSGLKVDGDTYAELRDCVDAIVDAAVIEARSSLNSDAKQRSPYDAGRSGAARR